MTLHGIDVSHHQGNINWPQVRAANKTFAIMKATQGTSFVDPKMTVYASGAGNAGMLRGFYHFMDASSPTSQADHFIGTIAKHRKNGDVLALDFERNPTGKGVMNCADPVGNAVTFIERVKRNTGVTPLIYMSRSTLSGYDWTRAVHANAGLWLASPGHENPSPGQWPFIAVTQTGWHGNLPGVRGDVDLDTFHGDTDAWHAYGTPAHKQATKPDTKKGDDMTADEIRTIVREEIERAATKHIIPSWHDLIHESALLMRGDAEHPDNLAAIRHTAETIRANQTNNT